MVEHPPKHTDEKVVITGQDNERTVLDNLYAQVQNLEIEPDTPNDYFIAVAVPEGIGKSEENIANVPCGSRSVAAIRIQDRLNPAQARSFATTSGEPRIQSGTTADNVEEWGISILDEPVVIPPRTISTILPSQLFEYSQEVEDILHDDQFDALHVVGIAGNDHRAALGEKPTIELLEEEIHQHLIGVFDRRFQERIAEAEVRPNDVEDLDNILRMGFVYRPYDREHTYPMLMREMAHAITSKSIPEGYEDVFHWFDWTYRVRMHDFEKLHAEETDGRYTPKGNLDMFAGDLSVYLEQAGLARLAEETDRDYIERVYREKE